MLEPCSLSQVNLGRVCCSMVLQALEKRCWPRRWPHVPRDLTQLWCSKDLLKVGECSAPLALMEVSISYLFVLTQVDVNLGEEIMMNDFWERYAHRHLFQCISRVLSVTSKFTGGVVVARAKEQRSVKNRQSHRSSYCYGIWDNTHTSMFGYQVSFFWHRYIIYNISHMHTLIKLI